MAKSKTLSLTDPRHLLRFLRYQATGANEAAIAAIAKQENVTVATVRLSITQVEGHRQRSTPGEMDIAVRDLVISTMPGAKRAIQDLLEATELVEHKNSKTGRISIRKVVDKTTRLEAFRSFNQLIANMQPKQPMIEQNINQTTQIANTVGQAETFEEKLSRLRKQASAFNALPPEVAGVPTHIDAGEADGEDAEEDDDDQEDE